MIDVAHDDLLSPQFFAIYKFVIVIAQQRGQIACGDREDMENLCVAATKQVIFEQSPFARRLHESNPVKPHKMQGRMAGKGGESGLGAALKIQDPQRRFLHALRKKHVDRDYMQTAANNAGGAYRLVVFVRWKIVPVPKSPWALSASITLFFCLGHEQL